MGDCLQERGDFHHGLIGQVVICEVDRFDVGVGLEVGVQFLDAGRGEEIPFQVQLLQIYIEVAYKNRDNFRCLFVQSEVTKVQSLDWVLMPDYAAQTRAEPIGAQPLDLRQIHFLYRIVSVDVREHLWREELALHRQKNN